MDGRTLDRAPLTPGMAAAHVLAIAPALRDLASQRPVARERLAWPPRLDPAVMSRLLLSTRIHNALRLVLRERQDGHAGLTVTAGDLLALRGFGAVSLKRLLLKLGEFLVAATGPLTHEARSEVHTTRLDASTPPTSPGAEEAKTHLAVVAPALIAVGDRGWIRRETVVWPRGLDIRLIRDLRHANGASARLLETIQRGPKAFGRQSITANDILAERGFHRRHVKQLVGDLADFLIAAASAPEGAQPDGSGSIRSSEEERSGSTTRPAEELRANPPTEAKRRASVEMAARLKLEGAGRRHEEGAAAAWKRTRMMLHPILAMADQFGRVRTLGDILDPGLRELAALLRCEEDLKTVPVKHLLGAEPSPAERLASEASKFLEGLTPAEEQIVEHRLLRTETLESVGNRLGVSRERVRQLQARLEERLDLVLGRVAEEIASVIRPGLGSVCSPGEMDAALSPLSRALDEETSRLARYALRRSLNYTRVQGLWMDGEGQRALLSLKRRIRGLADDAGLVSKSVVWAHVPPDLKRLWPRLREAYGVHVIGNHWTLRVTQKARVKAALLALGAPAPASDIAEQAGVSRRQAAAVLSNLPSVVKTDATRWGIKDWVEEPYEGISLEVIKRIERDGGSTDTAALEHELPEKFGVKAESVRMYLKTDRFAVRNGRVSLADPRRVRLRPLDDVISGRTRTGEPYWEFDVKSHHLKGYSVTGFPAELADYAGCKPDSGIRRRLAKPQGCSPLSIRWALASTTGPSLGYIGAPLRKLQAREGDRAHVVFQGDNSLALELSRTPASSSDDSQSAEDILEAMRRRRQIM